MSLLPVTAPSMASMQSLRALALLFLGLFLLPHLSCAQEQAQPQDSEQQQEPRDLLLPFTPARRKVDFQFSEDWYSSCGYGVPGNCAVIGQPDYCCPSDCDCLWDTSGNIACCPSGENCGCDSCGNGYQQPSYIPVTTYVPETTWVPETTYIPAPPVYTSYAPPAYTTWVPSTYTTYVPQAYTTYNPVVPVGTTTVLTTVAPVTVYETTPVITAAGEVCSTLIENGAGLPTTTVGDCGTIVVVNAASRKRSEWRWIVLSALIIGFVHAGAGLLRWRGL